MRYWPIAISAACLSIVLTAGTFSLAGSAIPWSDAWPNTDFSKKSVDLSEISSGGPPRDGIPPIDNPRFAPASAVDGLVGTEPVIAIEVNGIHKAYPLRVMMWHEIVNDRIGNVPVAVTYCPLCDAAVVFDRRIGGRLLDFGTTGNLRNSDLVMWDRQTESWWQQFTGRAIVGELTGTELRMLPSRVESWDKFRQREGQALVLLPALQNRNYGRNPYEGYDRLRRPFLYEGDYPRGIAPMARVIKVGEEAWALDLLADQKRIESGDLILTWQAGQNSALDGRFIPDGRDIGNVMVQRRTPSGLEDVVHDVTFAFAFHAFHPDAPIYTEWPTAAAAERHSGD